MVSAHGNTSEDKPTPRYDGAHDASGVSSGMRLYISVVDDDVSVRESLPELLRELGFRACALASAEEFLASTMLDQTRMLVVDVVMPGMGGPELQRELARRQITIPIVFITAQPDDGLRRRLMETGAVDVLFKPFTESALLRAVTAAMHELPSETDGA
jgi:FixJ family two-component response regulator